MIGRILHAFRWELRLANRRGLYLPSLLLALVAAGVVSAYRRFHSPDILAGLACGYLVLAVYAPLAFRIRSEKAEGTLLHLNLSPLRPHEYLAAKLALGLLLGVPGGALIAASAPGAWTSPVAMLLGLGGGSALLALAAFVSMAPTGSTRGAWLAGLLTAAALGLPLAWELRHPWILTLFADPLRAAWMLGVYGLERSSGAFYLWAGLAQLPLWFGVALVMGKAAYGRARIDRP